MSAIVGSVVGAILSFLGKSVIFVAEHTRALIVSVAGLIGVWVIQRVRRVRPLPVLVLSSPLFSFLGLTFLTPF